MPVDSKLRLLVDADVIVAIGEWSDSSDALSSSSLSRCATISYYVPFSGRAMLTDRFNFGGSLAYNKLSIMFFAFSSKAFSVHWFHSSKKSGHFMVLRSKMSLCHLCFAVTCVSGFTYFPRIMTSTSSKVRGLIEFMLLNVFNAPISAVGGNYYLPTPHFKLRGGKLCSVLRFFSKFCQNSTLY